MFDANVLIFACRTVKPGDPDDLKAWCADSRALMASTKEPLVCSIAWMEFLRGVRPDEAPALQLLTRRVQVEAVGGDVVERATNLLRERNIVEKKCPKCNSWHKATKCDLCRRYVASKQNLNDAIIAAAAELHDEVTVLYCYDGGAMDYGPYLKKDGFGIRRPPNHIGPLYEGVSQQGASSQPKPR